MADITMCDDHACPFAAHCYRYTAPASEFRQSWFVDKVRRIDDAGVSTCGYYMPNKGWGTPARLPPSQNRGKVSGMS